MEKIQDFLSNRHEFKRVVREVYNEIRGDKDGLDFDGLKELAVSITGLGIPYDVFCDLEKLFVCFDFNGNGSLNLNESSRLIGRCLVEYQRSRGGCTPTIVPRMTPEEGGYTRIKILAEGGQGVATLVKDKHGAEVVLKSYSRQNENAGGLDELLEEAAHMKAVGHCPNVAHCLDLFQDDDYFYMVSGANFGGDWTSIRSKATEAGVALKESWFRGLFTQAYEAIKYLHGHAITHCDLKEPNVMLKDTNYEHPTVVLIDLGLSQAFTDGGAGVCGTPGYIPPETWETGLWIPKGDIYSMTIVCYQVLTDQSGQGDDVPPYCQQGNSMNDIKDRTTKMDLPLDPLPQDFEGLSALASWLQAASHKDWQRRPNAQGLLAHPWFSKR